MAMAMPVPFDDKSLIVSYSPADNDGEAAPPKATSIVGLYTRMEPGSFQKEGGGKVTFDGNYWYIYDQLGQQVAWAGELDGRPGIVPKTGWQTKGEGFFGSWENLPITVEFRKLPTVTVDPQRDGGCCGTGVYQSMKEQLPDYHRESLEGIEAASIQHTDSFKATLSEHWPTVKGKAQSAALKTRESFNEHYPVVKQKTAEGCGACYDFWTHPGTVSSMKSSGNCCLDGIKCCLGTCIGVIGSMVQSACSTEQAARPALPASASDPAMDESYVKLDSTTPMIIEPVNLTLPELPAVPGGQASLINPSVEPTTLPPNRGDNGPPEPDDDDLVIVSSA